MQLIDISFAFFPTPGPGERLAYRSPCRSLWRRGVVASPLPRLPIHLLTRRQTMVDRETIITDGGGGGGGAGAGMIAAIVVVLLLLIAGGYLVINHGGSGNRVTVDV